MKTLLIGVLGLVTTVLPAQSLYRQCNFDNPGWQYNIDSSAGTAAIQNGLPPKPAGATYGHDSSFALTASNGEVIIEFDPVDLTNLPHSYFTFKLGALGGPSGSAGMDKSDQAIAEIRTDSSAPWIPVATVSGYFNARWDMSDEHLCFAVSYPNTEEFVPFKGSDLGRAAPGSVRIESLPASPTVCIRIRLITNNPDEIWSVDNVELHTPLQWTGAAGDGVAANPLNWNPARSPDSLSAVWLADTTQPLATSDTLNIARLITTAVDTLDMSLQSPIQIRSEWIHLQGRVLSTAQVILGTRSSGAAEITLHDGMIDGALQMFRSIEGTSGWRHVAVPVSTTWSDVSEHCTQVNYSTGNTGSIWYFDAPAADWAAVSSAGSNTSGSPVSLYTGPGWVELPGTWHVEGQLRLTGDTVNLQHGVPVAGGPFNNPAGNEGWNLVGNPFPMALDWRNTTANSSFPDILAETVYTWSADIQDYVSYNPASGGVNGGEPYIAPWQAFWVQMTGDTTVSASQWIIHPDVQGAYGSAVALKTGSTSSRSDLLIEQPGCHSGVALIQLEGARDVWDARYDHRHRSQADLQTWIRVEEGGRTDSARCALKAVDPDFEGPLNLHIGGCSAYDSLYFSLDEAGVPLWLEDRIAGIVTHLNSAGYRCYPTAEVMPWRFRLWTVDPVTMGTGEPASPEVTLPVRQKEWWIMPETCEGDWRLYDSHGRMITTAQPGDRWSSGSLARGVYIWQSDTCGTVKWLRQ